MEADMPPPTTTPNQQDADDAMKFILKLNDAAANKPIPDVAEFQRGDSDATANNVVLKLESVLQKLHDMTEDHKPEDYSDCRFGSKAHPMWLHEVQEMWDEIANTLGIVKACSNQSLRLIIRGNFIHSFGNQVRIDYGTGHELQFVIFLKRLRDVGLIRSHDLSGVALRVMSRYFRLIQHLIDRYRLEPAGSKGAWGIDHYQFLPFVLGSAQLMSNEAIKPGEVVLNGFKTPEEDKYIFLQTVEYIKRKVRGMPLEIASPMLHGICASCTWSRINSGLLEMYKNDIAHLTRVRHGS
ncbi:phosphotyrosyl phosphatase activator, putative [Babesia bigemina]|uniref:Serine/threonine-protein phosphatase 2A activator n=1 Tax=Babesia bigemina TaxID=5866 RepID=A0A061D103_BABBI|nr:phosphotyrosyl phosphatase activator, putative [Babesia bigemina]CDR94501.1 phosphotyrosyl phosphatase activator, putative [Babesia bigemina]|eukprot:XP_012766687.1 phosphotyrosyl phosphatase activator, putative [Babesia bigemina]